MGEYLRFEFTGNGHGGKGHYSCTEMFSLECNCDMTGTVHFEQKNYLKATLWQTIFEQYSVFEIKSKQKRYPDKKCNAT